MQFILLPSIPAMNWGGVGVILGFLTTNNIKT
jgi:hypothetical protein